MGDWEFFINKKRSFFSWNPIPLDFLLEKYSLKNRHVQTVIGLWVFLIAISMASVILVSPSQTFLEISGQKSLYNFFIMYPPLLLGTLMLFWLGFEWGFIPVFLSAFMIAYASFMPYYWAILFGIAFVLGLAIFALCYHCIPISYRLENIKSVAFFTSVSFVAAIASSLGSFVWSLYHDLSATETITMWKGWWAGTFLQSIILVGPFLYFFTPTIERLKKRYFVIPESTVSLKWIYTAIGSVVFVLMLFIFGADMLGSVGLKQELALLPPRFQQNFLRVTDSFQIISWISIVLVLASGLGGIYLVGSWNRRLKEEVDERTQELRESESMLKITLQDRDMLLKKIHNRVNHNLTMVLALLELQLKNAEDKPMEEILKDSHSRLRSMAVIYETMHQTESINFVNLKRYIVKLSNRVAHSFKSKERQIEVSINADEVKLEIERAVPFAMILNELLVNAYVHAFKDLSHGTIFIELTRQEGMISLSVRDTGIGIPTDFNPYEQETLGMKLITTLTRQLHGDFKINRKETSGFILSLPVIAPAA